MIREPAVAGQFYPSDPAELSALVAECLEKEDEAAPMQVQACLVPHAGYRYSGHVAGAVFNRIQIPKKIVVLGVRHRPPGSPLAVVSRGGWRTPLGDAPIDEDLASKLCAACPLLREDALAHRREHSLEVQLPFLQTLEPQFTFVPIALGNVEFNSLVNLGEAIGSVLAREEDQVLLLTTSDLNHYDDDATTRLKDRLAIDQLLKMDAQSLYNTCRNAEISMCGLGPAVAMLSALRILGAHQAELIRYATSGDRSGDLRAVVGYAGMIFS